LVVRVGDQLVLTGSSSESSGKLAARLDAASSEWIPIPEAPVRGFQLMRTDRGPLLNAHFTDSLSWLLDPRSWTWSALPQSAGETNNLSGVLDRDRASYDIPNSAGGVASVTPLVVYDSGTQAAVTIPAPPGREGTYGESSTALGRDLFVFGGQRWTDDGVGELVGDAMLWTAPLP
jgi:hypothetical protein